VSRAHPVSRPHPFIYFGFPLLAWVISSVRRCPYNLRVLVFNIGHRPWILNIGYPRVPVFSVGHPKYQPQCWLSKGPGSSTLAIWGPQLSTHPSKGPSPQHWPSKGPGSLMLAIWGPGLQHQPSKGPSPMSAIWRPWILNVGYPRVLVFSVSHPKYQSSTSAVQRPWVLNVGYLRVLILNVSYPTALGPHCWLSEGPGLQHQPLKGPGPQHWPSKGFGPEH